MNMNLLLENRYAKVYTLEEKPDALICEALVVYIPEQNFKELFASIADFLKKSKSIIKTFVFDKRSLTTFHQASMTWYHIEWKPEMLKYGLQHYRKILPKDSLFRKSVEIGRGKITNEYPDFDWQKYDIQYCESIEEALHIG